VTFADGFTLKIPPNFPQVEIEKTVREHYAMSVEFLRLRDPRQPSESADGLIIAAFKKQEQLRSRNIVCRLL
jgi:hypothetical protein